MFTSVYNIYYVVIYYDLLSIYFESSDKVIRYTTPVKNILMFGKNEQHIVFSVLNLFNS